MKIHDCCKMATKEREGAARSGRLRRRGAETAGWILPTVGLILMPKCPVCLAAYVALFTGVGISVTRAASLRTGLLILCVAALAGLTLKNLAGLFLPKQRP